MATQDAAATGPELPSQPVTERGARFLPGLRMLVLGIVLLLAGVALLVLASHQSHGVAVALIVLGVLVLIATALVLRGLTAVVPGHARVVQLFGRYRGTIRERKAAMVSNLLVVLCSEQATQQVVNTGSLYQ
jgi:hypothetical protein